MSTQLRYILIALTVIVFGAIAWTLYRMFWQFDQKRINDYISDEAKKYKDTAGVTQILREGVQHILASHTLTQQVLSTAKATNTDKENILVHAAINQCVSNGYLPK